MTSEETCGRGAPVAGSGGVKQGPSERGVSLSPDHCQRAASLRRVFQGGVSCHERERMRSAERLNHDQFDLLCRACDAGGPLTLAELSEVLDGENLAERARAAAKALIADGFLSQDRHLYAITDEGLDALA